MRELKWGCLSLVMEKLNFIRNGVSRLPPGFRFQPTDEELVFEYLKSKVFSSPLPASIIPHHHINVSKFDPWDLPPGNNCDDEQQERYFFSSKEAKYRNGNRINRTTKCGYWKATGSDKKISSSSSNAAAAGIVGIRKTLIFYQGKSPNGSRTNWVLHEYRLLLLTHHHQSYGNEIGDWVLCRVSKKKTSTGESDGRRRQNAGEGNSGRFYDFMMLGQQTTHSSSCSSSTH